MVNQAKLVAVNPRSVCKGGAMALVLNHTVRLITVAKDSKPRVRHRRGSSTDSTCPRAKELLIELLRESLPLVAPDAIGAIGCSNSAAIVLFTIVIADRS